jgi:Mg-chelatase subunit ChlD
MDHTINRNRFRRVHRIGIFTVLVALTLLVAQAGAKGPETVTAPLPPPLAREEPSQIEIAFALDTTGSMSGLIEGAKQKIWSIANQMADTSQEVEIRIGLVGYRDRGDQYVTRLHDLTDDIDSIYGHLRGFRADGGGDTPESVNQALHTAVTKMSWSESPDVYKVVFLVGDAPPHMNYADDVKYSETARLAAERGITLNTIQCGDLPDTSQVWQQIAKLGNGRYVAIQQDGAMFALTAPMDEDLSRLNRELAATALPYGDEGQKEEIRAKLRRSLSAAAPAAASRLSYLAKAGGKLNSGRSDLVDAVKDGLVDLDALPGDELLPAEMRGMSDTEQEPYVRQRTRERERIREEIAELGRKRDAWVRAESERLASEGRGDGFDQEVLETIRSQAAEKGIRYE